MRYLIFDFETTGVGEDKNNGYKNYSVDKMPLPRENYPVELGLCLMEKDGTIIGTQKMLICGAERLDPWVEENCSHLSVKECNRDGIPFSEALKKMGDMIGTEECMLVAHNIQYDWDDVILRTVKEQDLQSTNSFLKLKSCKQFCTCVNYKTKAEKTAYLFKRIGKWIGPSLEKLAIGFQVPYDGKSAHDALYDVTITAQCMRVYLDRHGDKTVIPTRIIKK
jgi:DNA polymerase III epsilon subunit-like protein